MADLARSPRAGRGTIEVHDRIDVAPTFTNADVAALTARFAGVATETMLAELLAGALKGRVAAVSSFGVESAVLLDLVARCDRDVPVIFVDTGKMFAETLAYRDALVARLGLTDLRVEVPDAAVLAADDASGLRWSFDPDGCCAIRKVAPLTRALHPFDAWLSGRKGFQAATRARLPTFELDAEDSWGRLKINPLADWDKPRLDAYFAAHDLPRHPLEHQGFASIGCMPCTTRVAPGDDPRSGRWRGWDKTECGIHASGHVATAHDPAF